MKLISVHFMIKSMFTYSWEFKQLLLFFNSKYNWQVTITWKQSYHLTTILEKSWVKSYVWPLLDVHLQNVSQHQQYIRNGSNLSGNLTTSFYFWSQTFVYANNVLIKLENNVFQPVLSARYVSVVNSNDPWK